MSWLARGVIIAIVALGMVGLLLFPEWPGSWFKSADDNELVAPVEQADIPVPDVEPDPFKAPMPAPKALQEPVPEEPLEEPEADLPESAPESPVVVLQPPPLDLNDSDNQTRSLLAEIMPGAELWLIPVDQIRKWVGFMDRIAYGKITTKYRPLEFKITPFKVLTRDGRLYVDPTNYQRFDRLIDAATTTPPEVLVRYYRYWQPLLAEAYRELGNDMPLDDRVRSALDMIITVKPIGKLAELMPPTSVMYKYADPALEEANEVSKWLWRIGPENANQLQRYVKALRAQLGAKRE